MRISNQTASFGPLPPQLCGPEPMCDHDLGSRPSLDSNPGQDKVVPPEQSMKFYESVKGKGPPTVYVAFEGEQHGIRRAENLKRSNELEPCFHSRVFDFQPGEEMAPFPFDNLTEGIGA